MCYQTFVLYKICKHGSSVRESCELQTGKGSCKPLKHRHMKIEGKCDTCKGNAKRNATPQQKSKEPDRKRRSKQLCGQMGDKYEYERESHLHDEFQGPEGLQYRGLSSKSLRPPSIMETQCHEARRNVEAQQSDRASQDEVEPCQSDDSRGNEEPLESDHASQYPVSPLRTDEARSTGQQLESDHASQHFVSPLQTEEARSTGQQLESDHASQHAVSPLHTDEASSTGTADESDNASQYSTEPQMGEPRNAAEPDESDHLTQEATEPSLTDVGKHDEAVGSGRVQEMDHAPPDTTERRLVNSKTDNKSFYRDLSPSHSIRTLPSNPRVPLERQKPSRKVIRRGNASK